MDDSLSTIILDSLADDDKRNILNCVIETPRTISEILYMLQLPETSGYRKVHSLIDNGLLIIQGNAVSHNHAIVNKYKSRFENLEIKIKEKRVNVRIMK